MQYALLAAAEALQDAGWAPSTDEQRQYTGVAVGNGMSSTAEVAEAGQLIVGDDEIGAHECSMLGLRIG